MFTSRDNMLHNARQIWKCNVFFCASTRAFLKFNYRKTNSLFHLNSHNRESIREVFVSLDCFVPFFVFNCGKIHHFRFSSMVIESRMNRDARASCLNPVPFVLFSPPLSFFYNRPSVKEYCFRFVIFTRATRLLLCTIEWSSCFYARQWTVRDVDCSQRCQSHNLQRYLILPYPTLPYLTDNG